MVVDMARNDIARKFLEEDEEWLLMVGVAQERKLLRIPRGVGNLRAEVRVFEEERGCPVQEMLVARDGFLQVLRLVGLAGLVEVKVHVEHAVREGHVIFVGDSFTPGVNRD